MKLLGYCRVSSVGQDKRDTIEKQVYDLQDYCSRNSHELVQIFQEKAVQGATDFDKRPAMNQLIDTLKADPELDGFLVYQMDRFARDVIIQEIFIVDYMKKFPGKKILSIVEGDMATDDPTRVMLRQIVGAVSQWSKSDLKKKMNGGKMRKARGGDWAGGVVPYGYTYKTYKNKNGDKYGEFKINKREADVVKLIFRLSREGWTLKKIADKLTAKKYPVPKSNHKSRKEGGWSHVTVWHILNKTSIYYGKLKYGGIIIEKPELALFNDKADEALKKIMMEV